jgi:D-arabinose 1-dehydrogenase-like Zn-dependent alcohol dehydrogenase
VCTDVTNWKAGQRVGLAPGGKLIIVGAAPEPLSVSPVQILLSRRSIQGWPSGTAKDSEDALQFSVAS